MVQRTSRFLMIKWSSPIMIFEIELVLGLSRCVWISDRAEFKVTGRRGSRTLNPASASTIRQPFINFNSAP